jgi:hypothetical protein
MAALALLAGCNPEPKLFEKLDPNDTGIHFANELPEDTSFNILNYLYYYNGGGVAAGDVNNDGLPDLFFTSNLGPDRLYLNRGNYRFEDVTERAGVAGIAGGWTTGVTMADVNGDGHLDIYVSGVTYLTMQGRNVLYMNDGDATFTDRTKEFGLEHAGYSTQALFFDYDADGDLDMYLLNNSVHTERGVSSRPQREYHPRAGDRLFRNDDNRFTDVSKGAGIYQGVEGYGLGVTASDLNLDGCVDLFVANDFQENDFLYYNNCDGTFTESIATSMGHTSRFSMGVDAADFNNDLRPDVVVVDMLPDREAILKSSANAESFNVFNLKTLAGYHPQYARNTLQLNRGGGRFSEIGYLAGVSATDWSWAPLFADFDNDGRKDLFITNGIYRRPNDLDYINYISNDAIQRSLMQGINASNLALIERMPRVPLPNHAFRNEGDLTFVDRSASWGLDDIGFSNGAVYVDLTNSGALDLVVNNINAPASIYRNRGRESNRNHFVRVRLQGAGGNTAGIGAKVIVRAGDATQMLEQMPTRGFQSAVDARLHFGLGAATRLDSLVVVWPDRRFQVLTNAAADREITLRQADAAGRYDVNRAQRSPLFATDSGRGLVSADFTHRENVFFDYNYEPLMPHLLSAEGPALAVGDVNGDALDDIFVGGARWQADRLYMQRQDGSFRPANDAIFRADSLHESVDATFFDAENDGDQDLYVVSGGNEFPGGRSDEALRGRLYINDGLGNLTRNREAVPPFFENGSVVVDADFNGDGFVDLFVGSRVVARKYGLTPRSHLLQNDGKGNFLDVTLTLAPALGEAGMVTSAAWLDYNNDGRLDLIVAGEWMPIRVFAQEDRRFVDRTKEAGLGGSTGWWNSITLADVNDDGRRDLILGNLGLNSYIKASSKEPARLFVRDFEDNGTLEQILTFSKRGVSYPLAGRDEIVRPIPSLRARYPSYASFGASRIEDIFPSSELKIATVLEASTFASSVAINKGDGTFSLRPLPVEAQFAPVYAAVAQDFDSDGRTDIVVAGNFHGVTPVRGRYDASYGLFLRGGGGAGDPGDGTFAPVDMEISGLVVEGQVRDIRTLRRAGGGQLIVIARNNGRLQFLRPLHTSSHERGSR